MDHRWPWCRRVLFQPNRLGSCCYLVTRLSICPDFGLEILSLTGALPDPILPAEAKPMFLIENAFDLQGDGWTTMNLMFFQKVWCYQNRASRNWNFEVNVKVIQFGSRSHKEVVLKQCSFLHRLTVKGSEVRLGPLSKDLKTTHARACTKVPTFGTWNEVESAEISFPVAPTWHRQLPEIWPRAWTPELLVQRADVFLDFKLDRCTRATVAARLELYDSYCFSSCTADAFIYQPGSSPCKRCSAGILMTQGFCGWHVEVGDCRTLEETQLKASRFVRMFLRQWFSPSFWVWYSWRFNQATCLMGYSWDAVWLFRGHVGQKKQRASGTPGQRKMMWMGGWYVHWLKVVVAFQVRLRRATLPRISVHQYMISHLPMTFR